MPVTFEKMEKSKVPRNENVSNKHMPDDLVLSILSKLPVKSLKRFGCTCKSWGRLFEVENTGFMNMFCNNFISNDHVYLNGMFHWRVEEYSTETVRSFDLSNEVFLRTSIPLVMEDSPSDMDDGHDDYDLVLRKMVVLNESIALISKYVKTNTLHVSILGELGVKESWVKLFIVGPFPCVLHNIGARKNGDIFFMRDNELVWCDLSTQMIEELGIKREPTST